MTVNAITVLSSLLIPVIVTPQARSVSGYKRERSKLHVAGPSEVTVPGIGGQVYSLLRDVLSAS